MVGMDENSFGPDLNVTRGMIVTILSRLSNADLSAYKTCVFKDCDPGEYYTPAVQWAYENGIAVGMSETEKIFAPDANTTREQLCALIARYVEFLGMNLEAGNLNKLTDAGEISVWAKDSVAKMVGAEIIVGNEKSEFLPQDNATRAQCAVIFKKLVVLILTDSLK
jgi:hypothetical protein